MCERARPIFVWECCMSREYNHPISLTIPIPTDRPKQNGIHSSQALGGSTIYVRCNPHEAQIVEKACQILNLKLAQFARDATVNAADAVVKSYEDYLKRRDRD